MVVDLPQWQYGETTSARPQAVYKAQPDDFRVREVLGFDPVADERGQHHWLYVEKWDANTEFIARQLARYAGITLKTVGYSGLKDRQARTWQWFSVELPATASIDWQAFEHPNCRIVEHIRSSRKLRRGVHQANWFGIRLQQVSDQEALDAQLQWVAAQGVPNYFGEQRFGRDGANLQRAHAMLVEGQRIRDRHQRGLFLSAARSFLFNQVVSQRIEQGSASELLEGDVCMLAGTQSVFVHDGTDQNLNERLHSGDIRLTAPLPGRGRSLAQGAAADFEAGVLAPWQAWCEGLERAGVEQSRRPLWLQLNDLSWHWEESACVIEFTLERGSYATSVLREIADITVQI